MDISPNYSATIFGFGTAIASLPGFFNALLMDVLIEGTVSVNFITIFLLHIVNCYTQGTLEQWRQLFLILAGILVFGSCFFGHFADSEVEPHIVTKYRHHLKEIIIKYKH